MELVFLKKPKLRKEQKKQKKLLRKFLKQCELCLRLERNEPLNKVPLEKEVAFPLNLVGKGAFFLFFLGV